MDRLIKNDQVYFLTLHKAKKINFLRIHTEKNLKKLSDVLISLKIDKNCK